MAGPRRDALDAELEVAVEAQRAPRSDGVEGLRVAWDRCPGAGGAAVVEHRLAEQLDLDRAMEALDRANEHVVGVVIGRRARVSGRCAGLALAPGADDQRVADERPSGRRLPGRLEHVGARLVAAARGNTHAGWPETESPGAAIEDRGEHARRI